MSRLQFAIDQIVFARNYTLGLLDQTPTAEWYRQPPGGVRTFYGGDDHGYTDYPTLTEQERPRKAP